MWITTGVIGTAFARNIVEIVVFPRQWIECLQRQPLDRKFCVSQFFDHGRPVSNYVAAEFFISCFEFGTSFFKTPAHGIYIYTERSILIANETEH